MRSCLCVVALSLFACSSDPGVDVPLPTDDAGNSILPDGAVVAPDASSPTGDSSVPAVDASVPVQPTASVRIIVEPSDGGAALVAAINGASSSVHMTMYLLTSTDVINALIARKKAGRDVKVVLNQNTTQSANQPAYDALKKAGVGIVWAPSGFTFTHEKCVIVDSKEAWIMTMNATQSSPTANREYLAVDTDPSHVAEAESIFQADWASKAASVAGSLVVAPVNARPDLVSLVAGAKSAIDIEAEELSDPSFTKALGDASARGVKVHIVLSNAPAQASQTQAVAALKQKGVALVQVGTPYIHAKSMVVDGTVAFVGSENFSAGSLGYNRELGVLFSTAVEVSKVQTTTAKDFAAGTPL